MLKERGQSMAMSQSDLGRQKVVLQTALDHMADAVVVSGPAGELVHANAAARKLFNLQADLQSISVPNEGDRDRALKYARQGAFVDGVEFLYRPGGGDEETWLGIAVRPLGSSSGPPQGGVAVYRNITFRKRAEEALLAQAAELGEQSRVLDLILQSAGEGICGVDLQGRATFVNSAAAAMLGYAAEDLEGKPLHEIVHPASHAASAAVSPCPLEAALAGQTKAPKADEVFWRKNGKAFPVEYVATPIDDQGRRVGTVLVFKDVTERKKSESELKLLQVTAVAANQAPTLEAALAAVLRRVCDATGWIIGQAWVPSSDGTFLECCPAWHARVPGLGDFRRASAERVVLPNQGIVGRAWTTRQPTWVRDVGSDPDFPRALAASEAGIKAGVAVPIAAGADVVAVMEFFVFDLCQADERQVDFIMVVAGQLGSAIQRRRALEGLKESEERLRLALQAAEMGTFDWDMTTGKMRWSEGNERLFGFAPGTFRGTYKEFSDRIHPDDREGLAQVLSSALEKQGYFAREYRVVWPDQSVHWVSGHGQFAFDALGKPIHMRGVVVGIADRKKAEEELQKSLAQLRALTGHIQSVREEERTRIAREIHDELGQALTGMKMDVSWIKSGLARPEGGLAAEALQAKLDAISTLIDTTIRTVRRIATELRPGVLDDLGLVAAIEWQAQDFQKRTGIRCRMNTELETVEVGAECSTALFRITQETLTNIARHAGASEVKIGLKKDQGQLILEVEDNGKGVTEKELARTQSLGVLGMRERAGLVGGRLEVVGIPTGGTRVTAWIPLEEKPAHPSPSHP
jgi:PAS domain S-box-containing protein